MIGVLLRVASGLLLAVLVAGVAKAALIGSTGAPDAGFGTMLRLCLEQVAAYGLPLALPFVIATEIARARRLELHLVLGVIVAFGAAHLISRGEPMTSPVFESGALRALSLSAIGALAALAYWLAAGRHAGWRGDATERALALSADAFRAASVNAKPDYCSRCANLSIAAAVTLFAVLAWVMLGPSGLRERLVADAERSGNSALTSQGHEWATFAITADRGEIGGTAPDELQARAAYGSLRDALEAVVGFPGVLAMIENRAVVRTVAAEATPTLDAGRGEKEAQLAAEAARTATEAARAAAAEAKRIAAELSVAAREGERRAAEEKARVAAAAEAPPPVAPQPATREAKAAIEQPGEGEQPQESVGDTLESDSELRLGKDSCSSENLAVIKSSVILFNPQWFQVEPTYAGELDRLAAAAKACAPRSILVAGHADLGADMLFNERIALLRALSVRDELVARGVDQAMIVTKSPGVGSRSEAQSTQVSALNRRAEFKLLRPSEVSRDATQTPDERAARCESDLAEIMAQSIIRFKSASARIDEESLALIKQLALAVQTCGSVVVTVEGHTDRTGSAADNQQLSEARASTVREALVAAGADPTRLGSRGFASTRPYDATNTLAANALNRRIEFRVTGKFTSGNTGGP